MREVPSIETFETASTSASARAWVERRLRPATTAELKQLADCVDAGDFTIREWLEALAGVQEWMDERGLDAPLPAQIGYVECSAAAAGAGANLTDLAELTREMLDQYGFEGAEKA